MLKKSRTAYHGVGRDTNAERVILYTLLGSIFLFTPAVRVLANTAYERNLAVDTVTAPALDGEVRIIPATPQEPVLQPKLDPVQPAATHPSPQH